MRVILISAILTLIPGIQAAHAEAWVRGAAMVVEAAGEVALTVLEDGSTYESFDQPKYFPGIFSCRAESGGSVLMRTSNQMTLVFRGAGFFAVERFEGLLEVGKEGPIAESESRLILNLRRGELMIDSRPLSEDSRLILETPFGRISGTKTVLLVGIQFDYRSGIYDFTISCADGKVRLKDRRGQSYTIYAGQRISGAGSYVGPTIEVGDQTEQIREKFDSFFKSLENVDLEGADRVKLQAHTRALANVEHVDTPVPSAGQSLKERKRPRVIEFAAPVKLVTPFRGEPKPPSESQADLF